MVGFAEEVLERCKLDDLTNCAPEMPCPRQNTEFEGSNRIPLFNDSLGVEVDNEYGTMATLLSDEATLRSLEDSMASDFSLVHCCWLFVCFLFFCRLF